MNPQPICHLFRRLFLAAAAAACGSSIASAADIIVDNTQTANVVITGTWTASTSTAGFYGTNYLHDGNTGQGTKSVRFTPTIPSAGNYEVFARWTSDPTRASNVPIDIIGSSGTSTVTVNQRQDNGVWVSLGIYAFPAGSTGNVLIRTTGANGHVIADAVRFVSEETIIDNTNTSSVAITGAWTSSTATPGYYGTDYLHDGNAGQGTKSIRFTPTIPVGGNHQVFARWIAASSRATAVPIDITSSTGTTTVTVNQTLNNAQWVLLGTYNLAAGTTGNVLIRTTGANGYVIADAVRFLRVPAGGGSGNAIVSDQFGGANGASVSGRAPANANLPATTWSVVSFNSSGSFGATISTSGGNPSPMLLLNGAGDSTGLAAVRISSQGSYTKPERFTISGDLSSPAGGGNAGLGFYSQLPVPANGDTVNRFFTGLRMTINSAGNSSNGTLVLYQNGFPIRSAKYTGTFNSAGFTRVSYDVDTLTGSISNVIVQGSTTDYSVFDTKALTNAGTTYAGVFLQGSGRDKQSRVDNFSLTPITTPATAPAAPAGLNASPTHGKVRLSWRAVGATSYNVYRGTMSNGQSATPIATGLTIPCYTDTTVTNGTNYFYKVRGVSARGTSALSNETIGSPFNDTLEMCPFGVSVSSAFTGPYSGWMPEIRAAGVKWARLFSEWNGTQTSPTSWNHGFADGLINYAEANGTRISGIIFYNASWVNSNTHSFPMNNLAAWGAYAERLASRYVNRIRYWEVWNEPQSFSNNGSAADYGTVVKTAYLAAKAVNPNAQIGISVASVDVPYLKSAIINGAADHFDFVCVHPYEIIWDMKQGWEGTYVGVTKAIRNMLLEVNPAKANVPIWYTEIGQPVGGSVTQTEQANGLVKGFTLGIASGVDKIQWFEPRDGDSGPFGLSNNSGVKREGYYALKTITTYLGTVPVYQGWVMLNNRDYGFVFNNQSSGGTGHVMVTWTPPGLNDPVTFANDVQVVNPLNESVTPLAAGATLTLTNSPKVILSLPSGLVAQAQANKNQPIPWGNNVNYTSASSVNIQMTDPRVENGIHILFSTAVPPIQVDSVWVRDLSGRTGEFGIDTNFLSYNHTPIRVDIEVRSKQTGPASVLLRYEGLAGWKDGGSRSVPEDNQWRTLSYTVTDSQFIGFWASNFELKGTGGVYIRKVTITKL